MISAYQSTIGKSNYNLTDGKTIYWKNVRKLVSYLAENEWKNITNEYKIRERWEKRNFPSDTPENKMNRYLHIPIKNRELEKQIDPFVAGWEYRYYKTLFHIDIDKTSKKEICVNYLEGLDWTLHYYTQSCSDWRWSYRYAYPPLFKDLIHYIPYCETIMIEPNNHVAVSHYVQLAYVLPKTSLYLLPKEIYEKLLLLREYYYPDNCEIIWAFCKYFWESHVELPTIDIEDIEEICLRHIAN